jgi:hypothetical protein
MFLERRSCGARCPPAIKRLQLGSLVRSAASSRAGYRGFPGASIAPSDYARLVTPASSVGNCLVISECRISVFDRCRPDVDARSPTRDRAFDAKGAWPARRHPVLRQQWLRRLRFPLPCRRADTYGCCIRSSDSRSTTICGRRVDHPNIALDLVVECEVRSLLMSCDLILTPSASVWVPVTIGPLWRP